MDVRGFLSDPIGILYSMKIFCDNWQDALDYFLNPKVVAEMKRLRLDVLKMDWRTKEVHIGCSNDGRYEKMLEEMAAIGESGNADQLRLDLFRINQG